MDCIMVRYGIPALTPEEKRKLSHAEKILRDLDKDPIMKLVYKKKEIAEFRKIIALKDKIKEVPIKDFLALDAKDLTPEEKVIQSALSFLYEQNAQTPPIYKSFPKRDEALVVDCTVSVDDCSGQYYPDTNEIRLKGTGQKVSRILEIIAHELKHAEQDVDKTNMALNNYQLQQLGFLDEALAYACDKFVLDRYYKEFPEEKREKSILERLFGSPELDEFEGNMSSEWAASHVKNFMYAFVSEKYKENYDEHYPILYTDKGLTSIPSAFGIDKKDMIAVINVLNEFVSKKAKTPLGILFQAVANEDSKKITRICRAKDSQKEYVIAQDELELFVECGCLNSFNVFKAVMDSNRFEKEACTNFIGSVLHVSEDEALTDSLKENRLKNFEFLITKTNENGKPLFSNKELAKLFSMIEDTAFNDGEIELQKAAKHVLNKVTKQPVKTNGKAPRD